MVIKFLKIGIHRIERFSTIAILVMIIVPFFSCNENRKTDNYNRITNGNEINNDIENTPETRPIDEQKNLKTVDSVVLLEGKIIFDGNFNPSLSAELKNNMKIGVIALEIVIDPNEEDKGDCKKIIVKRRIFIPPGKTVRFKQRINSDLESDCGKIEDARIYLGDFILKNGEKTNSHELEMEEFVKDIEVH